MEEYQWPYSDVDKIEFLAQIAVVEKILQKYGAEYVEDFREVGTWIRNNGTYAYEKIHKRIWKRKNNYIRVDRVYFPQKPFLVLEFSEHKEGPYEDADPFPYDLSEAELEQEIRYSLGIENTKGNNRIKTVQKGAL
ncbi:MAG: hypothetical protein K2N90_02160 [Lachnospiraceae bacterium]|nr:hypothetical protein [Lachnospiraceae bacterium]